MIKFNRNRLSTVSVAFAMITVTLLTLNNNGHTEEDPKIHIIEIQELKFIPNEIHVKPGDIVQWVNNDFIPHTATGNDKKWDSELIKANTSWQMTVNKETFENYFYVYHPGMKGKIKIIASPPSSIMPITQYSKDNFYLS